MDELEKVRVVKKAYGSFPYFIKFIFPCSFRPWEGNPIDPSNPNPHLSYMWLNPPGGAWVPAPHTVRWAKELQENSLSAKLCARKHLKSTTLYAYVMWLIFRTVEWSYDGIYISFNKTLSEHHIKEIKKLVKANEWFDQIYDFTRAETLISYSWQAGGEHKFTMTGSGIGGFTRGYHPDIVICDDILADPENPLTQTVIDTISRTFFDDIMSLPVEGGELHLFGTPQTETDVFFQVKERGEGFFWAREPAIKNSLNREVVWPNLFTWDRLQEIRTLLGEKSFLKEYMVESISSTEQYFSREELDKVAIFEGNLRGLDTDNNVYAGWDLGKKRHPSHISIFEVVDGVPEQVYQKFWDGVTYNQQLKDVVDLHERFMIDKVIYDATRGEFELEEERGEMPKWCEGLRFTNKTNHANANHMSKFIERGDIGLINDDRMLKVICQMNNDLKAVESELGHGDSFWSIALALIDVDLPQRGLPVVMMSLDS